MEEIEMQWNLKHLIVAMIYINLTISKKQNEE
jgi:hypothetical protein